MSSFLYSKRVVNSSDRDGKLPLIDSSLFLPPTRQPRQPKTRKRSHLDHTRQPHTHVNTTNTQQLVTSRGKPAKQEKLEKQEELETTSQYTLQNDQVSFGNECFLPKPPSRLGQNSLDNWASMYRNNTLLLPMATGKHARGGLQRVNAGNGGVKSANVERKQELLDLKSDGRNCKSRCVDKRTHHVTRHVTHRYGDVTPPSSPPHYRELKIGF